MTSAERKLLAAAGPDLLAACVRAECFFRRGDLLGQETREVVLRDLIDELRSAISKAEREAMKQFRFSVPVTFRFSLDAPTQEVAQAMARSVVAQLAGDIVDFKGRTHSVYEVAGAIDPAIIHGSNDDVEDT